MQVHTYKGHVSVGAAAPTLFSEGLFCTHRNPLKCVNIKLFHHKLIEFDFLHPQLSLSYATPVTYIELASIQNIEEGNQTF